ncbi:MAG: glycosyl hydrolase family 65 protein, partial [Phycisphaerae bacterium]
KKWKRLQFSIRYRGLRLRFRIEPRRLAIQADAERPPVPLIVLGRRCVIRPGDRIERRRRWSHKP